MSEDEKIIAIDGDFKDMPEAVKQQALQVADTWIKANPGYSLDFYRDPTKPYKSDLEKARSVDGDKETLKREEVAAYLLALSTRHLVESMQFRADTSEQITSTIGLNPDNTPKLDYVAPNYNLSEDRYLDDFLRNANRDRGSDLPSNDTVLETAKQIYSTAFASSSNLPSPTFKEVVKSDGATDFHGRQFR